jgi:hypothetical protein
MSRGIVRRDYFEFFLSAKNDAEGLTPPLFTAICCVSHQKYSKRLAANIFIDQQLSFHLLIGATSGSDLRSR